MGDESCGVAFLKALLKLGKMCEKVYGSYLGEQTEEK